jgi:hypothetical protein
VIGLLFTIAMLVIISSSSKSTGEDNATATVGAHIIENDDGGTRYDEDIEGYKVKNKNHIFAISSATITF